MVDELIAFLALAHSKSFVSSHKFQGIKESAQLVISELFIALVIEWRQSCMTKRYSARNVSSTRYVLPTLLLPYTATNSALPLSYNDISSLVSLSRPIMFVIFANNAYNFLQR